MLPAMIHLKSSPGFQEGESDAIFPQGMGYQLQYIQPLQGAQ